MVGGEEEKRENWSVGEEKEQLRRNTVWIGWTRRALRTSTKY